MTGPAPQEAFASSADPTRRRQPVRTTEVVQKRSPAGTTESGSATLAPDTASRRRLLSYSEQVRLAQQMERGDEAQRRLESGGHLPTSERVRLSTEAELGRRARRSLIEAHAPLVLVEARRFAVSDRRTLVDLVHEGNMGLVRAVNEFDWRRGVRLAAFAARWIRLAILAGRPDLAGRTVLAGGRPEPAEVPPGSGGPSDLAAGPSDLAAGPSDLAAGPSELAGPSPSAAGPSDLAAGPSELAGPSPSAAGPSELAAGPSELAAGPSDPAEQAEEDPDPAVVLSYRRRVAALEAARRQSASLDVPGLAARVQVVG